jgi:predicted alpha/beta-fold hydrolase
MTDVSSFVPHPFCRLPDVMTMVPRWRPRRHALASLPLEERLFQVEAGSYILGRCHWQKQPSRRSTLLLVHGFEGCSESHYMLGLAAKGYRAGFNVIRLNQRNCGGTEHLTPTLYHSGLYRDFVAVMEDLMTHDGLKSFYLVGYSMGGNLALNVAGYAGRTMPSLQAVAAACPNIDPALAVEALDRPRNWMYQRHFLKSLQTRMRRKAQLFPGTYDLSPLDRIASLREFDNVYTAPSAGYLDAADYYERTGARQCLGEIRIPSLILAAQDDPFIPFRSFDLVPLRANAWIRFLPTAHGGHCGFLQRGRADEDVYWAENRIVEFLRAQEDARH